MPTVNSYSNQASAAALAQAQQMRQQKATELKDKNFNLNNTQQINEAAEEFEAIFVSEMLRGMFEGVDTDPIFGGGHAEDTYRDMMIDEYGKIISRAGGIGLADHVRAELLKLQEVQSHGNINNSSVNTKINNTQ